MAADMPPERPPIGPQPAEAVRQQQLHQRIGQLAEAEQRLRAVVDNVVDGIITISEEAIIESFNPAARRLFGYTAAEVIGRNVSVLMPEPYRGHHDGYVGNYRRTGVPKIIGIGREVLGLRKDGSVFPMDLAVSEFTIDGRRAFVGIVRDISEKKDAERRKEEFLAMLAHELRNPLAPIRSGLDLLEMEGVDTATAAWARDMMKHQVQHLVRLVDDLLDVSRIMRGKVQVRKERLPLKAVIDLGLETAQPLIASQGHEVVLQIAAAPIWIEADPVRIAQVITNLLNNAAKYNNKPGHIWVTARRNGEQAVVQIRDDGIGIEPELLPHVFDLFTQANRSLARSQGGLGIGLTLVRSLVEMHGGSVEARSEGPDKGSEFTIRLPAPLSLTREATPASAIQPALGGPATRCAIACSLWTTTWPWPQGPRRDPLALAPRDLRHAHGRSGLEACQDLSTGRSCSWTSACPASPAIRLPRSCGGSRSSRERCWWRLPVMGRRKIAAVRGRRASTTISSSRWSRRNCETCSHPMWPPGEPRTVLDGAP